MNYFKHLFMNLNVAFHALKDFFAHFIHGIFPFIKIKHHQPVNGVKAESEVVNEKKCFDFGDFYDHTSSIREMVLEVIDKYKEESEGEG